MASSIAKGAIISYISIFLNIIISFIYTPWMIHQIGVSDYGLYSLIMSFISYFIMDFGLNTSITRFIAKYRAEGNEEKVANMLGLTTKVYLAIDALIFLVLFVLYFFISDIFKGLTPEEIAKMKILYCIAGGFSVLSFVLKPMDGAMMAFEYFVENKILDMVLRVGTVVLIVIALILSANVYWLVLVNGAVAFAVSLSKYIVLIRKSRMKINWSFFDKNELKVLFSFSIWIFLIGLAQRFRLSLINTVLGIYSNSVEIALFALGMTIEGMVYLISSALNGLFLPKVSRMSFNNERSSIITLMIKVGRIQLYIISLIFSGFCIFGDTFINLWVGEEFHDVYFIVIFLIATNLISLTQHIANDLVYAENKVKYTAQMVFVTSIIGLGGACLVSAQYGAVGAAACTALGLIIYTVVINVFYYHKLELDIKTFFKECHLRILPLLVVLSVIFYYATKALAINTWSELMMGAFAYVLLYALLCYFVIFNNEEKQLVKSVIIKLKNKI